MPEITMGSLLFYRTDIYFKKNNLNESDVFLISILFQNENFIKEKIYNLNFLGS